ncbi:hypothetical protein ACJX0J_029202, partial [Zea mays]
MRMTLLVELLKRRKMFSKKDRFILLMLPHCQYLYLFPQKCTIILEEANITEVDGTKRWHEASVAVGDIFMFRITKMSKITSCHKQDSEAGQEMQEYSIIIVFYFTTLAQQYTSGITCEKILALKSFIDYMEMQKIFDQAEERIISI